MVVPKIDKEFRFCNIFNTTILKNIFSSHRGFGINLRYTSERDKEMKIN